MDRKRDNQRLFDPVDSSLSRSDTNPKAARRIVIIPLPIDSVMRFESIIREQLSGEIPSLTGSDCTELTFIIHVKSDQVGGFGWLNVSRE